MSGTAAHTSGTGFWHARDSHTYARATPPTDLYPAMRRRDSSAQIIEILFVGREIRRSTILRSEEHTSELQSRLHLVCRLLLEKKKNTGGSLYCCCSGSML